jgi:hypothetical protein
MGDSTNGDAKSIHWTEMLEEYFASTGEKAHCLSWCHKQSEAMYSNRKTWIDLPVIVISGVTGFLSAGSTTMFSDPATSSVALGVASLFVSVLNTAGSYYGWAKRAEGHRISAIHYARLYRFISVELSLPRDERLEPAQFLKYVKDQYDRLQEISPMLPPEVIDKFQKRFGNEKEISKPEEANGLEKITVFRNDVDLNVSDPGEARSVHSFDRTPKLALPRTKTDANLTITNPMLKAAKMITKESNNPVVKAVKALPAIQESQLMVKAAQMAKRVSPDVLSAAAPAPPTPLNERSSEGSISSLEASESAFVAVVPEGEKKEEVSSS